MRPRWCSATCPAYERPSTGRSRSSPRAMVMTCVHERERRPCRRPRATPTSGTTVLNRQSCGLTSPQGALGGLHRSRGLGRRFSWSSWQSLLTRRAWQRSRLAALSSHSQLRWMAFAPARVSYQPGRSGLRSRASPPAIWPAVRPSSVGRVIVGLHVRHTARTLLPMHMPPPTHDFDDVRAQDAVVSHPACRCPRRRRLHRRPRFRRRPRPRCPRCRHPRRHHPRHRPRRCHPRCHPPSLPPPSLLPLLSPPAAPPPSPPRPSPCHRRRFCRRHRFHRPRHCCNHRAAIATAALAAAALPRTLQPHHRCQQPPHCCLHHRGCHLSAPSIGTSCAQRRCENVAGHRARFLMKFLRMGPIHVQIRVPRTLFTLGGLLYVRYRSDQSWSFFL
jgi:hypothetical protein